MTPNTTQSELDKEKLCKKALDLAIKKSNEMGVHHYLFITECYKKVLKESTVCKDMNPLT